MKPIRRAELEGMLDRLLPEWEEMGGWTYNVFFGSSYLRLGAGESIAVLHAATAIALAHFQPQLVHVFHDGLAAWRTRWRGNRGYCCASPGEAIRLIEAEAFFRDPNQKADNYNIIGETGEWMITYCHEDDWFLFAPQSDLDILAQLIPKASRYAATKSNQPLLRTDLP